MKLLKLLLLPIFILIQILYFAIIFLRNFLYDYNIIPTTYFKINIISIGSLKLGGAGKTPLLEYLIKEFSEKKIAVLSRGYKRHSKGFLIANKNHTSFDLGDEVRQIIHKNPNLLVAVDKNRIRGVKNLIKKDKSIETVFLDDAYQHRQIGRDLNILVTEYQKLYSEDQLFPLGNLREYKSAVKRAKIIVVTKSPKELSFLQKEKIKNKLTLNKNQMMFFSHIKEYKFVEGFTKQNIILNKTKKYFLMTGIANSKPLINHLDSEKINFSHFKFADHHFFQKRELTNLIKKALKKNVHYLIITEKDFYRLSKSNLSLLRSHFKLFYTQIAFDFIHDEKRVFHKQILKFI